MNTRRQLESAGDEIFAAVAPIAGGVTKVIVAADFALPPPRRPGRVFRTEPHH